MSTSQRPAGGITQATSRSPGAGAGSSGLLLVVHVPDNVGNVLVAVLLLLDKGGVAQGRALEFYLFLGFVLGALDHFAIGGLLALSFPVRFFERHEFGIGDIRRPDFLFSRGLDCTRRGGGIWTCPCPHPGKLQDGLTF